jgi:hypothetical protein
MADTQADLLEVRCATTPCFPQRIDTLGLLQVAQSALAGGLGASAGTANVAGRQLTGKATGRTA